MEAMEMSRGEMKGWDRAYDELINPDKKDGTKVKRKKKATK